MAVLNTACRKSSASLPFAEVPVHFPVTAGIADEASGIADHNGGLWVIQDSGQPTALYLFAYTGGFIKKVFIKDVTNRDWEELAVADGPIAGKKYIYIAETGDNSQQYSDYIIYRFEQPTLIADTVSSVATIRFSYPDGSHDAEAFFVDPATKDIYIITKRDAQSKVYKLAYPQSTTGMNTVSYVTSLPYTGVVAASFSASHNELVIKTYSEIYYYKQSASQSITALLASQYNKLFYELEPQGEAICITNNDNGFYTLSEKALASAVTLNYYKRN